MVSALSCSENERSDSIGRKYKISFSDHGSFGQIYLGYIREAKEPLAIKVESIATNNKKLEQKAKLLKSLQGGAGIPRQYDYIEDSDSKFILMELLGKNFELLFPICNIILSLKTHVILSNGIINCNLIK